MDIAKRVAVIGAGVSGLSSIKSLKEEGIYPICFEKTDYIGGVWKYHEDIIDDIPSMPWYTHMDHSKEMWAFSDFPPKKNLPNFMKHTEVYNYLQEYAQYFDLLKHIKFKKEVVLVTKSANYDETGKWILKIVNSENPESIEEMEFDGVLISAGYLHDPYIPDFVGLDRFRGKVLHTHDLKRINEFCDQNVLVIGGGSCGFDAAVQVSNVAKKVYFCVKDGAWVFPCTGPKGVPYDHQRYCRIYQYLTKLIPGQTIANYIQQNFLNSRFDHDLCNLKSNHSLNKALPVMNDGIGFAICSGKVIVKKKVRNFRESGVVFEESDRDMFSEVDTVIQATGYKWKFPFLDEGILDANGTRINLFKSVYPPQLQHPTLAFIGFIKPNGPTFPVCEIQSRWASAILKGRTKLPSQRHMMVDIALSYDTNLKRYPKNQWTSLIIDYTSYMDDISTKINSKPNLIKLFFDPRLFYAYFFEGITPYQYRLNGPNAWPQAREAILTAKDRVHYPFGQRNNFLIKDKKSKWTTFKNIFFLFLTYALYRIVRLLHELKRNPKLKYRLMLKLFPYVNKAQQIIYDIRNFNFI